MLKTIYEVYTSVLSLFRLIKLVIIFRLSVKNFTWIYYSKKHLMILILVMIHKIQKIKLILWLIVPMITRTEFIAIELQLTQGSIYVLDKIVWSFNVLYVVIISQLV